MATCDPTTTPTEERDLNGTLFDMENDVRSTIEFFHAIRAMAEGRGKELDENETRGLVRVVDVGLNHATAVQAAWERAYRMAVAQSREARS